jgi:hypothetical protein
LGAGYFVIFVFLNHVQRMKLFFKNYWALLGLILIYLILKVLSFVPEAVTDAYSLGVYPKVAAFSRIVFGTIPFSVGDVFYFVLIFFLLRWIWLFIKNRKTQKKRYFQVLFRTFVVVYALHH